MLKTKDGKKNSRWASYNENGKIDGKWTTYHENGQINEEKNYKDGVLDGKWTSYYENGQLREEGNYKDGELDGKCTFYYENGQISEERNHFNKRLIFKVKELLQIVDNSCRFDRMSLKGCIKIKNNLINNGWNSQLGFDFSLDISIGSNGLPKKAILRNGNHRLAIMKKYGLNYNIPTHLSLFYPYYYSDKHLSEKYIEKYPSKKELLDSIKKHNDKITI